MTLSIMCDEGFQEGYCEVGIYACKNYIDYCRVNQDHHSYKKTIYLGIDSSGIPDDTLLPDCDITISVFLEDSSLTLYENQCAMISMTPTMPDIFALPMSMNDDYLIGRLKIRYNRSNRNDYKLFCDTILNNAFWDVYELFDTLFYGGEAVLSFSPLCDTCATTFRFSIRGYNPEEYDAESYIEDSLDGKWYAKYVAIHESGWRNGRTFLQFNEIGSYNCDSSDIKYTPNWGDMCVE